MNAPEPPSAHAAGSAEVCVRFWASARAAAGVPEVVVRVTDLVRLDTLIGLVLAELPGRPQLERVLRVCSVLVGDRPVGSLDPERVEVAPGDVVELLPPFAGG